MGKFGDALVIDDDPDVCETLKMHLEALNIFRNVQVANDGVQASNKLQRQCFDVILMDINMPKMDGVTILESMGGKGHESMFSGNKASSVIVVSGVLNKSLLERALKQGVRQFIVKPIDKEQFKKAITAVLKAKRQS